MRNHLKKLTLYSVFLLVILIMASCGEPGALGQVKKTSLAPIAPVATPEDVATPFPQSQVGQLSPVIDKLTQEVLLNIRQHGANPAAQMRGQVVGGLFINWKMDDPSQTNALKIGSDAATADKHDPQVELYYLNALAEYRSLHPQDHTYDADLQNALKMVITEFTNYNLPKGWIYFYLLRSGELLHNQQLINEAHDAASNYFSHWFAPGVGIVYNLAHDPGIYNVEHTLNCGAALLDAGKRWNRSDWTQAGKSTIDNTVGAAIDPHYHLFYNNLSVSGNQQQISNHQAKPSTQGNSVEALVTAYKVTGDHHYLDVAGQILQSMFGSSLWDQKNGGLFFALDMDTNHLHGDYKETRGQTLSLIGLYHYNLALAQLGEQQQFVDKQQQLVDVLANHFYQSTYHGFFYRVTPAFQVYHSSPGTGIGEEDYFTTEAMGTAMDALQQTEFAQMPS